MENRIIDINGNIITHPQHYHECLNWSSLMIEEMERSGVDRSDMCVVIHRLYQDILFQFSTLRDRANVV